MKHMDNYIYFEAIISTNKGQKQGEVKRKLLTTPNV